MGGSVPNRDSNPFADAVGERHPARRFRGRLTGPVTIITSGDEDGRTGLTVSSIVVAEGEPPLVYFLLSATSDLFYAIEETRKFIVHVCAADHRDLADIFAGLRPSPGGKFIGRSVTQTDYGPVLDDIETRSFCLVSAW